MSDNNKNNIVMSKRDIMENRKKAVKEMMTRGSPKTWTDEPQCILVCPYSDEGLAVAVPEVWRPVDDRPINRRLAEYQLDSWFRRIHLGRLIEAGFPPPAAPPVESDSDDDDLYD